MSNINFATMVQQFKEEFKTKGESLVLKEIPVKILQLNEILKGEEWNVKDFSTIREALNIPVPNNISNSHLVPSKKRKPDENGDLTNDGLKVFNFPAGLVHTNSKVSSLIRVLKPILKQLVEDSNVLKMWISFMIPKIEDGNNFGVSIQEDTLSEVQTVETEAANFFDQISRYYMHRAKIVSKVSKYPHIDDYRQAVNELDEKQYLCLCFMLLEIRNHYSTLHDIVTKNLEKLKKPRNSNTESLY